MTATPRTSKDLRLRNRLVVLHEIYAAGSATRQELPPRCGLSFATVSNVVAELLDAGILHTVAHTDSTGGRPRAHVAVDPGRGALIGAHVAPGGITVDTYDLALRPVTGRTAPPVLGVGVATGDGPARPPGLPDHGVPVHTDHPDRAALRAELWTGSAFASGVHARVTLAETVTAAIAVDGVALPGPPGELPVRIDPGAPAESAAAAIMVLQRLVHPSTVTLAGPALETAGGVEGVRAALSGRLPAGAVEVTESPVGARNLTLGAAVIALNGFLRDTTHSTADHEVQRLSG